MKMLTSRQVNLIGLLACVFLVSTSFYFEYAANLEPCPLCIMQRLMIMLLGLVFLLSVLQNPNRKGIKVYSILAIVIAFLGAALSTRQLWLQHFPQANEVCAPELSYMLKYLPLTETVKVLLLGSGECSKINWRLLGITIPGWTLTAFFGFIILNVFQLRRK